MKFDPADKHYYFSTKQVLEYEERRAIINANTQNALGILRDVVNIHTFDEVAAPKKQVKQIGKVLHWVIAAIIVAAVVVPAYIGHTAYSVMNFGWVFIAAGIYCFFTKRKQIRLAGTQLNPKQFGIFVIMLGLFFVIPMIFIRRIGTVRAVAVIAGGVFCSIGLMTAANACKILHRNGSKYGKTVLAKCIGYVRFVNYSTSGSAPYVKSAEVFEYEYYGETCQAINSVTTDQTPATLVGTHVKIRLSPSDPFDVTYHGSDPPGIFTAIVSFIGPLLLLIGAACMFVVAKNMPATVAFTAKETETASKHQLTDGYIDRLVNDAQADWEIGYYTVLRSFTDGKGNYVMEFTDGTQSILRKESDLLKYPDGAEVIRISDAKTGKVYMNYLYRDWEYKGKHPVRDQRMIAAETAATEEKASETP